MSTSTYDVRIWDTRSVKGARGTAYQVRWATGKRARSRTLSTRKLAESFRAELLTAARKGEPFDLTTGLPVSLLPKSRGVTWLEFALDFVDMKWPEASPRHRKSTAEGLVTITTAMTAADEEPPDAKVLRLALMHWAFNATARKASPTPPEQFAEALAWISARSRPLADLAEPEVIRAVLGAISRTLDGSPAAASTANRKRAALSSAIGYAIEKRHLSVNPLTLVKVKRKKTREELDERVVVNHQQAKAYLHQVRAIAADMAAFYGCIYYAAMRPSEARNLRERDLTLPEQGWGEALLTGSYQVAGKDWTDDGRPGEERALKHRVRVATRRVPLAPVLVALLREHLEQFDTDREGRLFVARVGPNGRPVPAGFGGPVSDGTIGKVHRAARAAAFTEEQRCSPLAARAYDLRHAAVSTWLAAGVPPTQAAAWAGHSVSVLLEVYAHAVDGQADAARRRVEEALGDDGSSTTHPQPPVDGR